MDAAALLALVDVLPEQRDAVLERALGIDAPVASAPPGAELIGYHASGLAPVCRMVRDVPIRASDVFVDLGAGRGKVIALVRALSGARVRGIELQRELISTAVRGVELEHADVRTASLDEGTVFFLYTPFTGPVVREVGERLRRVAERHAIVVCTLGFTLDAEWLRARETDAFWLTVYDSVVPGVAPREQVRVDFDERLERLAYERR
ncbi:MAG: hypothetical protein JNM17_34260 [Archangium sp.]|nr:hypothetical protein [Archangium sp.]